MAAEELMSKIQAKLKGEEVGSYEIYMQVPRVTQLYLRRGRTELVNQVRHVGYGIRVLNKGFGVASSNLTENSQVEACARNAASVARQAKPEKFVFPSKRKASRVDIVDGRMRESPEIVVRDLAEQIIDAATAEKVELPFAKVKAYHTRTRIVNSEGLDEEKEETMLFTEVSFKTSMNGQLSEYWATRYGRRPEDIPATTLKEWAKLARENLRAEAPKTGKLEVILPPQVVCDLLVPVVGAHSTGRALKAGISRFEEGELVADETLTVIDDGLYPYGLQSSPFDDEGNPQGRTAIIEKGVFKDRLYDQYYGLQCGKNSTGNGIRQQTVSFVVDEKFRLSPRNQPSNLRVEPGSKALEELMSEVSEGLFIHRLSWLNPQESSGLFGSEIQNAVLIEDGEVTRPVKGGLISGDVFTMIRNITGISEDAEIASGGTAFSCISPHLRFKDVQIAGE